MQRLIRAELIAYRKPLYQVLSLDPEAAALPSPERPRARGPRRLGDIIDGLTEGGS